MNNFPKISPEDQPPLKYTFFPPRGVDAVHSGRDPHAVVRDDPLGLLFPTARQLGVFFFVFPLLVYLCSLSWGPFPGLPVHVLLSHLKLEAAPPPLDMLWGWVVRVADRLPGLSISGWLGLFSAVCGAASISLLSQLTLRVGYLIRNEPGPDAFIREARARRLSATVAGFFCTFCIPFWIASTRSLPASFHIFLLLITAWWFSQYQHHGRKRHLFLLCLFYGVGITEFATFIVYFPLAFFLIFREIYCWRAGRDWKTYVIVFGAFALGLSLYFLNAWLLYRRGVVYQIYPTRWAALMDILLNQWQLITIVRYAAGFPAIMFISLVPWLLLFVMTSRSPWFYEWGQITVRLMVIGGLLATLYNATFAPWNLLGMGYFMVTPYLLLAVCLGYTTGEFWILGEVQILMDRNRFMRVRRYLSSSFALLILVAVVVSGPFNWDAANGREGRILQNAANEILEATQSRPLIFSSGLMDDMLRITLRERGAPGIVITLPRISSPLYLKHMGKYFTDESLRIPLQQGNFSAFMDNLMMSEWGPAATSIIDIPDMFREYGYLIPDGFLYRMETEPGQVDMVALMKAQQPFWERMQYHVKHPVPRDNPIHLYEDLLRLMVSKVANNLGVILMGEEKELAALEAFRAAWQIYPDNVSAMLNLRELARTHTLPEDEKLQTAWTKREQVLHGERWALAIRYGYVWNASEWVRRGYVWVLSGTPLTEEAARRKQPSAQTGEAWGKAEAWTQKMDQMYLVWGIPLPDENQFRQQMIQNERDTGALMALCRHALRRQDPAGAEAYLQEAMTQGQAESQILFDRAMIAYAWGNTEDALAQLRELANTHSGDPRVWVALVNLTEPDDPLNAQAIKTLQTHRNASLATHLALASIFFSREQYEEAQKELDQAIRMDATNLQAWELMMKVAQMSGNARLAKSSMRALLSRDPNHFMRFQNDGVEQYMKGDLENAYLTFREGLRRRRDPSLLNNLAQVTMDLGRDLREGLALVNEANRRKPGDGTILTTRGEILIRLGRFTEARRDLEAAYRLRGNHPNVLLLLADCQRQTGAHEELRETLLTLREIKDRLDPKQKARLAAIAAALQNQPSAPEPSAEK